MKEENYNTDPIKLPEGSRKENPNDILKEDLYTNPIKINPEVEDKFSDKLSSDQYNSPTGITGKIYDSSTLPDGYDENMKLGGDRNIPVGESQSDKSSSYLSEDRYKSPINLNINTHEKGINETPIELVNKDEVNKSNSIITEDRYINPIPREGIEGDYDSKLSSEGYSSPIHISNVEDVDHSYILEESRYFDTVKLNAEDNSDVIKSGNRYQTSIELTAEDRSPGYLILERYIKPQDIHNFESISSLNTRLESVVIKDSEYTEDTDSLGYTIGGNHMSSERNLPPNVDPSSRRPRKDTPVGRSSNDTEDRKGLIVDDNSSESKISDFISNKDIIPIDRKIEDYRDIDESRYSGFKVELSSESNNPSIDKEKYSDTTKIPNYSNELPEIDDSVISLPVDTAPLTEDIKDKYANTAKWMSVQNDLDRGFNTVRKYEQLLGNYAQLGDWGQMVSSAVTGVLGAKNFRDNTRVPAHKVKALSELSAIRSTVQNNFTGPMGMAKQELIDELLLTTEIALRKARELAKENAGRLPGNNEGIISNFINEKLGGNIVKKGIDAVTGAINSVSNKIFGVDGGERVAYIEPKNRPEKIENYGYSKVTENLGSDVSRIFSSDYMSEGLYTTLSELANSSISNINDLSEVLRNAPYITSWNKIMDLDSDSNDKWEIVFKPFIGSENGNYTVLPDISEINTRNMKEFNVETNYTNWLPFTGFELQHKKLTNKSVGLFDGEFSIPVSLEFTNEIRLTISDDQCKSFRWYFDTCTEASMYKRVKDSKEMKKGEDYTKVYKDKPMTAMYKNATFECSIYVLKGDLATVKKFPLLITLRDYQVEYVGDQESSPVELSLHFSIVGELNTKMSDAARNLNSMELPNKPKTPSLSTPGLNSASGSSKSSASLSG